MKLFDKFQNLMVMAAADGILTEAEIKYLSQRCKRWGLSDHDFRLAIEYALRPEAVVSIPDSKKERVGLLQELIRAMAADGQLADIEKQLFATAAARMGISDDELNDIIDSVLR